MANEHREAGSSGEATADRIMRILRSRDRVGSSTGIAAILLMAVYGVSCFEPRLAPLRPVAQIGFWACAATASILRPRWRSRADADLAAAIRAASHPRHLSAVLAALHGVGPLSRHAAARKLAELIPAIAPSDREILSAADLALLKATVAGTLGELDLPEPERIALKVAVLDHFGAIGYTGALGTTREMMRFCGDRRLREAATRCRDRLLAAQSDAARSGTLLRPADAPCEEVLLRPAEPVAEEQLLRPAEGDQA